MEALVQFLRACLDEDERTARAVLWDGSGNTASWCLAASATVEVGTDEFCTDDSRVAYHIARHDPARVLAEVDAKRQALDHYVRIQRHGQGKDHLDYVLAEGAVSKQIQYMALPYVERLTTARSESRDR